MLKNNITKLLLFSAPFLLYMCLVLVLDPYNYFNASHLIPEKVKNEISPVVNECLWKLIDYNRKPVKSVLLGDSRMALLDVKIARCQYERKFYNLSYASASLNEITNSFWFICENKQIDTVFIAISFEKYSQTFMRDRVKGAISILNNPLLYFSNYNVPQASYLCLKAMFSKGNAQLQRPPMTKEEFWKYQIDVSGVKYYSSYKYSIAYHNELKKISDYCRKNKIKLAFILFPVHKDLQFLISTYNLEDENRKFLDDIKGFGDVYDFSFSNSITQDKSYFNDPFHIKMKVFSKYYLPLIFGKRHAKIDSIMKYYPSSH